MNNDNAMAQFAYYGKASPTDEALTDFDKTDCENILMALEMTQQAMTIVSENTQQERLRQVETARAKVTNLKGLL